MLRLCTWFVCGVMRKGILPLTPSKMHLPFHYFIHGVEGALENEVRFLERVKHKPGNAIDIGANVGLYSYKMSKHFPKVYSFEINDEITQDLVSYNPGNIEILNTGLSSAEGKATLYTPVLDGRRLDGWASLAPNNHPDAQEEIEKIVDIRPLDDFQMQDIALIKIDVEGHEVEVLKGAVHTLTENQPIVLVEVRPSTVNAVQQFFKGLNYQEKRFEDLTNVKGSEDNLLFVPA